MSELPTNLEKELIIEMAIGLARRLGSKADQESGWNRHYFQSDYETAFSVLTRLDAVAEASYDGDEGYYEAAEQKKLQEPYQRFCALNHIRKTLSGPWPEHAPELSEVLEAYIGILTSYGEPLLHDGHDAFVPDEEFAPVIQGLSKLGYLKYDGHQAEWTDKITPAMRAAAIWDYQGLSYAEALKDRARSELQPVKQKYRDELANAAKKLSFDEFDKFIQDRYQSLFFLTQADGNRYDPSDVNPRLREAVYSVLRDDKEPGT